MRNTTDGKLAEPIALLDGPFAEREIALLERYDETFSAFTPSGRNSATIQESQASQLAAWAIVLACLGTDDRVRNNVLWSQRDESLGHIDFEDSFNSIGEIREQLIYLDTETGFASAWASSLGSAVARDQFIEGVRRAHVMLMERRDELVELLSESNLDQGIRERVRAWINSSVEDKTTEALRWAFE